MDISITLHWKFGKVINIVVPDYGNSQSQIRPLLFVWDHMTIKIDLNT